MKCENFRVFSKPSNILCKQLEVNLSRKARNLRSCMTKPSDHVRLYRWDYDGLFDRKNVRFQVATGRGDRMKWICWHRKKKIPLHWLMEFFSPTWGLWMRCFCHSAHNFRSVTNGLVVVSLRLKETWSNFLSPLLECGLTDGKVFLQSRMFRICRCQSFSP